MTPTQIVPAVVVPLVLWRVYSRVRRNLGRQPLRPRPLLRAVIFFSVVTALVAVGAWRFPAALGALGGGLLLALPLALVALRLTRFETAAGQKYYTPNTAIGLSITLLFVGRIVYRMVVLLGAPPAADTVPPSMFQSPLTLVVFGLTAGYYIAYYLGICLRNAKAA